MIPIQKIIIKWHNKTKSYYEGLGYNFTNYGDNFEINVNDLSSGSEISVEYICDYCNGKNQKDKKDKFRQYKVLLRCRKNNGKDSCGHKDCRYAKLKESRKIEILNNNPDLIDITLPYTHPHLLNEWDYIKNTNITPFDVSKSSEKKVWWKCSKCNYEWDCQVKSRTILESGCPICSRKNMFDTISIKISHPEIVKQLHPLKNKNINLDEIGKSSEMKLWWFCKKCDHTWKAQVKSRTILNSGCPQCNESKGEKKIRKYLQINNIEFNAQHEFDGLLGERGGKLKFDFSIFNKSNKLLLLIEFDGEFHYMKIHETDSHEITKKHDEIKNEYCKNHNITLLRIPYWEFDNIEVILAKELSKYNLQ